MNNYGHQRCPVCPSSDAFFRYKDGHGHCYSCGYHDFGTKTISSMKMKLNTLDVVDGLKEVKTSDYSFDLPEKAKKWLKRYGISDKEIIKYGYMWNEKKKTLAFPLKTRDNKVFATNERYFGEETSKHPKYLTRGNKARCPMYFGKYPPETLVFVEDIVSAIKIGRGLCTATPLLGTTIPLQWINEISTLNCKKILWLDPNKKQSTVEQLQRFSQYFEISGVFSDKDPKDYDDKTVSKMLEPPSILTV